MTCDLVYTEMTTGLAASATLGIFGTELGYRLNSLYDPDYVSTGHQPYFYDQLAAIYNRYRVSACTIDLTFTDPTADGLVVAAQVKPSSVTGGTTNVAAQTVSAVRERPNAVCGFLNNTGGQKLHIRRRFTIAEAEGITPGEFRGDMSNYAAAVTANPTRTPYLQIAAAGLTSAGSCQVSIKLVFECEFFDRLIVAQS